jgi:5-formyltetrahydrofolate cyclo-ligase
VLRRLAEPAGRRLGPDAIARADVLVVPALAVDRAGRRLGQGGGSFDRALARARPDALVVALVHDDEVSSGPLPVEPHDRAVDVVVTPERVLAVRGG